MSTKAASFPRVARARLRFLVDLFTRSADRFDDIEGFRLGAAFACYATFAIFPLLLLMLTVVGFVIGDDAPTRERVLTAIGAADPSVRAVVDQTLTSMQESSGGRKTSAIIGLASLLFSASGAFVELDFTLNKIWNVTPRSGKGLLGRVSVFLHERASGLACVAGIGLFMIASLAASSTLNAVAAAAPFRIMPALLQTAELAISIALLSLAFAAAFHFVPRSRPPFRDVIGGAVLTTVLLTILKGGFALYLSQLTSYSAYGIVGSVLALVTWIYVSAQIVFFGATVTQVHCVLTGCPAARASASARDGLAVGRAVDVDPAQ